MPGLSTALVEPETVSSTLPALIDRAAGVLAGARTSAEILEAKEMASFAYDTAKKTARFRKAKGAHDALIAAAHRTQADALEIEAMAKRRLADEYDAAQERGEVAGPETGRPKSVPDGNAFGPASAADLGISRKDIHEARQIRDAEEAKPGIVNRTLQACVANGAEPTRSVLRKAVSASTGNGASSGKAKPKKKAKRGRRHEIPAPTVSQHERDLELIRGIWEGICESARHVFLLGVRDEFARAVASDATSADPTNHEAEK